MCPHVFLVRVGPNNSVRKILANVPGVIFKHGSAAQLFGDFIQAPSELRKVKSIFAVRGSMKSELSKNFENTRDCVRVYRD